MPATQARVYLCLSDLLRTTEDWTLVIVGGTGAWLKQSQSGTVEGLLRSAPEAGFEVVGMSGCFQTADPEMFELHAATLAAARERAISLGIAADRIDGLIRDIRSAKDGGYQWVSTPFYLDLTLRKPTVT
jgi:hypothetical protein